MKWSLKKMTTDPVCGQRIRPMKDGMAAVHGGRSYYFCSKQCRITFQESPTQYADKYGTPAKGWWGRYLERIEKSTGGKPPCCH